MSTSPSQPVVTFQNPLQVTNGYVQSEISALAHKHVHLSFAILGVLIVALGVACLGGYMGLRGYERALARAEAAEQRFEQKDQQYQTMIADFQKQITADAQERQQASAKQEQLQAQINARVSAPVPPVVQTGLKPDATAQEAGNALGAVFTKPDAPVVPMATPDGKVALTVKESQEVASQGLDYQRITLDWQDEISLYNLEVSKSTSLSKDLQSCQDTVTASQADLKDAKATIAAYKKAAVRSKWQKMWQGFKTYGVPVIAFALGRKL